MAQTHIFARKEVAQLHEGFPDVIAMIKCVADQMTPDQANGANALRECARYLENVRQLLASAKRVDMPVVGDKQ